MTQVNLSAETRTAIRLFWLGAATGRQDVRRLYVEARSMCEEELFNDGLYDDDSEDDVMANETTPPAPVLEERGEETQVCSRCGNEKSVSDFVGAKGKPVKSCAECRAKARALFHERYSAAARAEAEAAGAAEDDGPPGPSHDFAEGEITAESEADEFEAALPAVGGPPGPGEAGGTEQLPAALVTALQGTAVNGSGDGLVVRLDRRQAEMIVTWALRELLADGELAERLPALIDLTLD